MPRRTAKKLTALLGSIQAVLLVLFLFGTTYDSRDYSDAEYIIFRDIMVMLLLGFGFLMTFLANYGLGRGRVDHDVDRHCGSAQTFLPNWRAAISTEMEDRRIPSFLFRSNCPPLLMASLVPPRCSFRTEPLLDVRLHYSSSLWRCFNLVFIASTRWSFVLDYSQQKMSEDP